MKTSFISLLFVILPIALLSQNGTYYPIPESGAIWREYFGGYQVNCRDYQLSVTGDTIIGGQVYHNLQYFGVVHFSDPMGNCLYQFSGPYSYDYGAFRNDSINRKVYYWDTFSGEHLLYDFNLKLNDPLPECYGYRYYDDMDTAFVSSVDSVMINGEYHRRYGISNSFALDYVYLVEGIGSTYGLLSELVPPFEFGSTLICYMVDSVSVFPEWATDCELVTGLQEPDRQHQPVTISPNPVVNGNCTIRFPSTIRSNLLIVNDMMGREVLRRTELENGEVLNLAGLIKGSYLLRFYSGNQLLSKSMLIINQQ